MRMATAVTLLAIFCGWVVLPAGRSFGHGTEHHDSKHQVSGHMHAMLALKEGIPQELRIMQRTPVEPDKASLDRGRELFMQQCAACHGSQGRGDGPVAASLATAPANFLDLEHSAVYGPGEKYWIIGNGSGETGMPAFPQIELLDRWHLVNFIFDLQLNGGQGKAPHHHQP